MADIEKFDPSQMMDGVKDRIKATFASLIPDEAWDAMIKKTVDDYFNKINDSYNYDRYKYTAFDNLVFSLLEQATKEKIAEYLKTEEYTTAWDSYGKPLIGKKVNDMFIENSSAIFLNLIGGTFQSMLNDLQMRMRNNNR